MSEQEDTEAATAEAARAATVERIIAPKQWPIVVTLQYPIELGTRTINTLSFQTGRLGFLKGIQIDPLPPPTEQLMLLASRLCGEVVEVIEKLNPDDADEVLAIAMGFIGRCRGAGRKRSR